MVADLGCADGGLHLSTLNNFNFAVTGYDNDPSFAGQFRNPNTFIELDLNNALPEESDFDFLILSNILHCLSQENENWRLWNHCVNKMLNSDGFIYLKLASNLHPNLEDRRNGFPLWGLTDDAFNELVGGFEVIRRWTDCNWFHTVLLRKKSL